MRALIVMAILSTPVLAQPSDSNALAEQLFNQGRELAQANKWDEACPKFEASLRYDPVLGTRLNLATCYEHTGKLASAWGQYRDSIELAQKAGDIKRRDYAENQAAALEPRLPKLTIQVAAKPPAGLVVKRDGTPIDAGAYGEALYVDPGAHEIVATAPGYDAFTRTVTVPEGKAETLAIPDLKRTPVVEQAKPLEVVAKPKPEPALVEASPTRKYVGIGVGVGGVVAVGVGLVFGAKASSTYSEAKTLCGQSLACAPANYDKGKQLISDARSNASLSTVLVIAGGAAIAAGAVLWITAPKAHRVEGAAIVPVIDRHDLGLAVMGRF